VRTLLISLSKVYLFNTPCTELGRPVALQIIFTYILGYPVEIGHMEAVNLISSSKYSEKQIVRYDYWVRYTRIQNCITNDDAGLFGRHIVNARKFGLSSTSHQLYPERLGL
jgi:hypothetical protein